jgi:hypothetical protein
MMTATKKPTAAQIRAHMQTLREERFILRESRILADQSLDPRQKTLYRDRTLIGLPKIVEITGYNRTWVWRRFPPLDLTITPDRPTQPGYLPDADEVELDANGEVTQQFVELGRFAEWWVQTGRGLFNLNLGTLVRNENPPRHGRPRHSRANLSKRPGEAQAA